MRKMQALTIAFLAGVPLTVLPAMAADVAVPGSSDTYSRTTMPNNPPSNTTGSGVMKSQGTGGGESGANGSEGSGASGGGSGGSGNGH